MTAGRDLASRVTVRRVPAIAQIGSADWARLAAGRALYLGYPWLAWAERSTEYEAGYLVAEDRDGRPGAALPTYLWRGGVGLSMNRAYHPLDLLVEPRLGPLPEQERAGWLPLLLLGSRAGYHGGIVVDPAVDQVGRRRLIAALLAAAGDYAAEVGARAMAMLYTPTAYARECLALYREDDAAPPAPVAAPLSAEAVIPVGSGPGSVSSLTSGPGSGPGPSPGSSPGSGSGSGSSPGSSPGSGSGSGSSLGLGPGSVSGRRRREFQREARAFAASGSTVVRARLSECYEVIGPLLGRLQRKYGEQDSDEAMTAYLADQATYLDPWSHVLLERRGGRTTGFCQGYRWGGTLHMRAAGFAEDCGPYAYFNLAVYEALRLARESGLTAVDLGTGAYPAKLARGAVAQPTWSLVWPPAGTRASWLEALRSPGEDYRDATR